MDSGGCGFDCQVFVGRVEMTTLTLETLYAARAKMEEALRSPRADKPRTGYGEANPWPVYAARIIVNPQAMVDTTERLFPESRHRSARIHKKLIKRYGGVFKRKPAIFRSNDGTIIVHPSLYGELRRLIG